MFSYDKIFFGVLKILIQILVFLKYFSKWQICVTFLSDLRLLFSAIKKHCCKPLISVSTLLIGYSVQVNLMKHSDKVIKRFDLCLTHLQMLLWQRLTRWKNSSCLQQMRRIPRYQKFTLIVYTHSRVKVLIFRLVLKEVISGIKVLREEIWRHVRILHAMSMIRRFFPLLRSTRLLLDTLFTRDINFRVFLSPIARHQPEIHCAPRDLFTPTLLLFWFNEKWNLRIIYTFASINWHTTTGFKLITFRL